ncbi:hypothetical protein N431DRAFT_436647 [Stipitochalara longipes BDJ]|nr:hypothetical protein N431DRAFT_436647 [Stipitochalara longipes BDJ]
MSFDTKTQLTTCSSSYRKLPPLPYRCYPYGSPPPGYVTTRVNNHLPICSPYVSGVGSYSEHNETPTVTPPREEIQRRSFKDSAVESVQPSQCSPVIEIPEHLSQVPAPRVSPHQPAIPQSPPRRWLHTAHCTPHIALALAP